MSHRLHVEAAKKASLGFLLLLGFMVLASSLHAQNFIYAKGLNPTPPAGNVISTSIKSDHSGNIYVTGNFSGTVDFDPGPGIATLTSAGFSDMFIARYNATGDYVYAMAVGDSGRVDAYDIAIGDSDNVYVTGRFFGSADFDPGPGEVKLTSNGGDLFFARYGPFGNYLYAKSIGGSGSDDRGTGIAIDSSGNVYLTGAYRGTVDFDPGPGIAILPVFGSIDMFIASFDPSGNYRWARGMGSIFGDVSEGITADAGGNIIITGNFQGTMDFDPGPGIANLTSAGITDIFIARFDASGNFVYARRMGGIRTDVVTGIASDNLDNVYITGYFLETADFDPGAGIANLTSAGSNDIFVARYDASGNYVYAKAIGNTGNDFSNGIATDRSGNAYVTGDFFGTVDFDPGAGVADLTSAGSIDIFIASYDSSGNYLFAKAMGGTGYDESYDIAVDGAKYVYVTGYFSGTADFDPGGGSDSSILTATNVSAIFIAKYGAWPITLQDTLSPIITTCPILPVFCSSSTKTYLIPKLVAIDNSGFVNISYVISGATDRSGEGDDASGQFNPGTSMITWSVKDSSNNIASCETTVSVNSTIKVTIPDAAALHTGVNLNTVYPGYAPASKIKLTAEASGGIAPYTYEWSDGSATASVGVSPSTTSAYSVTITDALGCKEVSAEKIIKVVDVRCGSKGDKVQVCIVPPGQLASSFSSCVEAGGVASLLYSGSRLGNCSMPEDFILSLKATPNPSSSYFNLKVTSGNINEMLNINIYNITGRLIETRTVNANSQVQIGVSYPKGLYFAEARQGTKKATVVLVKL